MAYDASRIEVMTGMPAVRERPHMYIGKQRADPDLLVAAFSLAVQDALVEEPAGSPLQVRVTVDDARWFTVEDNGVGLPVAPVAEGRPPALTEMLTELMCGQTPMRRWAMAMVTALCAEVIAEVWRDGRHFRQRADWTGAQTPLEALMTTDQHGTRVTYRFDDDYLDESTALPLDLSDLMADLLQLPGHYPDIPRPAPATRLELIDHRTGEHVVVTQPDQPTQRTP